MNIVYSSSDSYAPIAGVSLYSLLKNNMQCKEMNIFMVDNHISEKNKEKLIQLCSQFSRTLYFIPIADIEKLAGTNIDIGRWNISTFSRLFEASLLPEWVEKVIHIDCDTMIVSSLEQLWNIDMTGKIVAGALECISDSYKTEIGLLEKDTYLQAGNIMLNLKKIREDGKEELFKKYIAEHSHLSFVDQAVLNACIPSSEKLVIPLRYNLYSMVYYVKYENLKRVKRVSSYYSEKEVADALEKPCIVHFTTCFMDGTRPWMENNFHPALEQYLEYKKNSPWADEPLWKDPRNGLKKIGYKMFHILPESFVTGMIGFIHSEVIPQRNKHKSKVAV